MVSVVSDGPASGRCDDAIGVKAGVAATRHPTRDKPC